MDQKPSIGRIVHVRFHAGTDPYPAVVLRVNRDETIDVEVFGLAVHRIQPELRKRDDPARPRPDAWWEWPPRVP